MAESAGSHKHCRFLHISAQWRDLRSMCLLNSHNSLTFTFRVNSSGKAQNAYTNYAVSWGTSVADKTKIDAENAPKKMGILALFGAMAGLLLAGGILLDMDRINAVRDTLDRVAHVAAFEAVAAARPAERKHICQKRFNTSIWTDSEVSLDDVNVNVTEDKKGKVATVTYDVTVQLVVGRFFGFNEVEISGEAEVAAPLKQVVAATP
jgi:hypothetical protein